MTNKRAKKLMKIRRKINTAQCKRLKNILLKYYIALCDKYNCYIPAVAIIPDSTIFPHGVSGIYISQGAVIGENCTIFHQVTIGSNTFTDSKGYGSPTLGRNVFIGAGAKIIGKVKIGNNVRIGANAIITTDIPDNSTVVLPSCRIIKHASPLNNQFVPFSKSGINQTTNKK